VGGGVQLGPLGTAATNRPIVPAPGDYDHGEIGGLIGRENRNTRRKPAPVPLSPPQILHAARKRTRTAAVGSQRLTAYSESESHYIRRSVSRSVLVSSPIWGSWLQSCQYVAPSLTRGRICRWLTAWATARLYICRLTDTRGWCSAAQGYFSLSLTSWGLHAKWPHGIDIIST
jgi:hypothetical protein